MIVVSALLGEACSIPDQAASTHARGTFATVELAWYLLLLAIDDYGDEDGLIKRGETIEHNTRHHGVGSAQ